MLILSRDVNESICIGDDITVMVVDIRGGRVRLVVTAPGLKIHRQEIVEKIRQADELIQQKAGEAVASIKARSPE